MEEADSFNELFCWLVLMRSPGISAARLFKLVSRFGTSTQLVEADRKLLCEAGLKPRTIDYFRSPDRKKIDTDLAWLGKPGNTFISCLDNKYPTLLRNISDPPAGLFIRGRTDLLKTSQLAIIGTRKPTPGGKRIASEFASQLGNYGLTITSGLAVGIDTAAHEGALSSASPTIAVLANGLDLVYPKSNTQLAEKICENGTIVSEFPITTRPIPANFPRRNRIISGLSVGTLVVEAANRSGSLITAHLALEQGREVFAIPGSINNPVAAGCHSLISNGAKLTTNVTDILEEIGALCSVVKECEPGLENHAALNERLDEGHKVLLDNIGYEPASIDQLISETGMSASKISGLLLDLELCGHIDSLPGARFTRK